MTEEETDSEYKNPPSHYPDWNAFNDPSGQKQDGRFVSDYLVCDNDNCPSEGKVISEKEAFYLFAKQPLSKRISSSSTMCICPFCGGTEVQDFPFGANEKV